MSILPIKILLATDGSEEAELAARTATEPAEDRLRTARGVRPAYTLACRPSPR